MDNTTVLGYVLLAAMSFCCGYFVGKMRVKPVVVKVDKENQVPKFAYYIGRMTDNRIDVQCICEFKYRDSEYVICVLKSDNTLPPFPMRKDKLIFLSEEK